MLTVHPFGSSRALRGGLAAFAVAAVCASMGCPKTEAGRQTVRVAAASSLTDVFAALAKGFESAHPGAHVTFSFAGSQVLRAQIEQGAPVDVFASADIAHLQQLHRQGRVSAPVAFAQTTLAIVVPPNNPARLATVSDLPRASRIVIGTPQSPIGRYTRALFDRIGAEPSHAGFSARVLSKVVSEESNVRLVRGKVALGEADAAVVYASDVVGSALGRIDVPKPWRDPVRLFHAAVLRQNKPTLTSAASAWMAYLTTAEARAVLTQYGFTP